MVQAHQSRCGVRHSVLPLNVVGVLRKVLDALRGRAAAPRPEPPRATADPAEQLKQLNELREQGILSDDEFAAEKQKLLR